jgi:hypothetical protein
MLKNKINATEFNAFPADSPIRAEYTLSGSDYILQHDEPVGELKRAKDRETERANKLAVELSTEKAEHDATKNLAGSKDSPLKIAEKAKADALKEVEPQLKRAERLETRLKTQELSKTANDLALKVGGEKNKVAIMPHISSRLEVKLNENDEPVVVVKDANGVATALKPEDLEKEIRSNKDLAPLVLVAAANGGHGRQQQQQQQQQSPGSGATNNGDKPFDFNTATPEQRKAYVAEKYVQPATV